MAEAEEQCLCTKDRARKDATAFSPFGRPVHRGPWSEGAMSAQK